MCLQALAECGEPEVIAKRGGAVRVLALTDLLTSPFPGPPPAAEAGEGGA
jgi:hypothetical protein